MEVRDWEDLKRELCKKVDSIKAKGNLGIAEVDVLEKLSHSINHIDKIIDHEEDGYSQRGSRRGYSRGDGNWMAEGSYGSYNTPVRYNRDYSSAVGEDVRQSVRKLMNSNNLSMADRNALEQVMAMIE